MGADTNGSAGQTHHRFWRGILLAGGLVLCATRTEPALAGRAAAEARLINLSGAVVGYAHFRKMARGIMIEVYAHGLKPGVHAVMLHTSAACDPQKGFYTAGPDLDLSPPRPHGFKVTGGPRPGDLPNQYASAKGVLHADIYTTYFTLGSGKRSIFDKDGASIIIHATGDDYLTAPDGNSGRRVACGTIIRTAGATRHRHSGKSRK